MATRTISVCDKCGAADKLISWKAHLPGKRYPGLLCPKCAKDLVKVLTEQFHSEPRNVAGTRVGAVRLTHEEELIDLVIG